MDTRIPYKFNKQSERSFEDYMEQEAPVTGEEATSAAFELAFEDTVGNMVGIPFTETWGGRFKIAKEIGEGATFISPEEANQRFPGMPTPFREEINPYVAQLQYDQQVRRMELQDKIARGPQDPWTKTKVFGAGLLAHAMDPLELGAGYVAGWAVGGAAATGLLGKTLAQGSAAVGAGTASLGVRTGVAAVENLGGNLIENIAQEAIQAGATVAEGGVDERSTGDVINDISFNTFAASVFGGVVKEGAFQLNGLKRLLRNTSPQADLAVARAIVGNLNQDIKPDIQPILKALAQETSVNPKDFGEAPYDFSPGIEGKRLFSASAEINRNFQTVNKVPLGDDFGMGIHVTDNPGVANAAAARSMADSPGLVHEVEVGELRPVQLDQLPPENLKAIFDGILKDTDFKDSEGMTVREALATMQTLVDAEEMASDTMKQVKGEILKSGFNALQSEGKSHAGFDHAPHNHLTILDENLVKGKQAFKPKPSMINAPKPEDVKAAYDKADDFKQHTLVDGEQYDLVARELAEMEKEAPSKIKELIDENFEELKSLVDQKHLTPEEVKIFERLKEEALDSEIGHTLRKAVASCVGA